AAPAVGTGFGVASHPPPPLEAPFSPQHGLSEPFSLLPRVVVPRGVLDVFGCGGCQETWTGSSRAHCSGCHQTFSAISWFDAHRRRFQCLNPAEIGLIQTNCLWHSPEANTRGAGRPPARAATAVLAARAPPAAARRPARVVRTAPWRGPESPRRVQWLSQRSLSRSSPPSSPSPLSLVWASSARRWKS